MNPLRHILLVEDKREDVQLTLAALGEHKLANQVVVTRDGVEALDYLYCRGLYTGRTDGHPVVVLLDNKMPRLNGLQVLQAIKTHAELKTIPVVMLTSSREEPDLEEAYKLGANAYIVKPVDFKQFAEAVRLAGAFWAVLNEPPPERATNGQSEVVHP